MPPKNSGGSTKFPGGHKVIHRTAQTAFVRVVTPRFSHLACLSYLAKENICRYTVIIIYEIQTIRNCEAAGRSLGITRAPFRARENIFVRGWVLEGVDVSE